MENEQILQQYMGREHQIILSFRTDQQLTLRKDQCYTKEKTIRKKVSLGP